MLAQELIDFEKEIADIFEQGKIKAPVHLSKGNESQLIEIFKEIKPEDWVFSTHRSHYHALLKGIPKALVKQEILDGHSITLNFKEYRFFSSAIVGGILPIALGVAMAGQRVWCFIGDMAGSTGIFAETKRYAEGHSLPITFIIEDNGKSVNTPTKEVWGENENNKVSRYQYTSGYPHQGNVKWVSF